jgi:hypothetical protein
MRLSLAEYTAILARQQARQDAPAKGKQRPPPEKDLHESILSECQRRGWYVIHARMDQRSTIAVGAPDFVVFQDAGQVLIVEAKRPGGKLRPEQLACKAWLEKLGHKFCVVYTFEEFLALCSPC